MPWLATLTILGRAVLPVSLFDKIMDLLGVSDSMDHFKGREPAGNPSTGSKA